MKWQKEMDIPVKWVDVVQDGLDLALLALVEEGEIVACVGL